MTAEFVAQIVSRFEPGPDGLARKSKELSLQLLRHAATPFSRAHFNPGHITCTALVLHPAGGSVLAMHHHRLNRWLLPGGHVEETDAAPASAAAREAFEETRVRIDPDFEPRLAGIDVHGIPPKRNEPFHLHHDLIWCFRSLSEHIEPTAEAPQVLWAEERDWDRLAIAESIRNSVRRVLGSL